MIVDPWGTVLQSLGDEKEGICFADIDADIILKIRNNMPVLSHRRTDIY